MRINSRKVQKILGRIWTAPKRIFESFEPRCIGVNPTITTIFLIFKIKQGFSYAIFLVKKIECWKNYKIMRKLLFNYFLYSHHEIRNFRV
jgi:hypothetical protein